MAGLTTDKNGRHIVQFTLGTRRTISLGRIPKATAQKVHRHIEDLVAAARMQQSVEPRTAAWVGDLGDEMHSKLAAVGLVAPRHTSSSHGLGAFIDGFIAKRIDVSKETRDTWKLAGRNLRNYFGADKDITTIHEGDAHDFPLYLITQKLAPTTIHKRISQARMFFEDARRYKLIASNPFEYVKGGATESAEKFYVPLEMADRILEACKPEWRLIFALARLGGLRCPNEVFSLRWSDINFERDRILVTSVKTARKGKPNRIIWMGPQLRRELLGGFEALEPGAPDEIFPERLQRSKRPAGWRGVNPSEQFRAILKRAGYAAWPSLFNSLRSSCEIDLARIAPAHVVSEWMGHSVAISNKHYLRVTDDDFERAANTLRQVTAQHGTGLQTERRAR